MTKMNNGMHRTGRFVAAAALALAGLATAALFPARAGDYLIQPVPFTAVRVLDSFWSPRLETNRLVTVWFARASSRSTAVPH